MIRTLLALITITLLVGCASMQPQLGSNGQLQPPAGMAYAIVGVTMHSYDDISSDPDAALELIGPAGRTQIWANTATAGIVAPGDAPNGNGRLSAVALAPGDYVASRMYGSWLVESGLWRRREMVTATINAPFSLKAGEVVYLGDAHLNLNFRPSYELHAERERDFHHMQTRWGVTDTSNIRIAPLQAPSAAQ
ncbi:hypothetical protein [Chitinilyticum piscinae]|uniref:Lipoprotein n=1 Tax=Chitinilyticum piscinae TaxID=2866724 RepID=A0A8J7FL06_9NEIS|nr:hypothetical protein [Chitinilyticum piscinae]MBE9609732.1 hypothetical protein [Chitinilyticum piscinae]